MKDLVTIRGFQPQDWDELVANAAKDEHSGVYFPTHVSVKNNEIVGYLSIGLPTVLCWQHREKIGAVDSLRVLGFLEGALCNSSAIIIPCDEKSPYNNLLPKAGYVEYTKPVKLYVKGKL